MEKWNERLAHALGQSAYNANQLAKELRVSAPTVSAWIGAAGITPARDIKGENLLLVCRLLNVRPEWLMFREGSMRPAAVRDREAEEAVALLYTLPDDDRALVIAQIKRLADLTSENVNSVTAEKSGTISHRATDGRSTRQPAIKPGISNLDEAVREAESIFGVQGASSRTEKGKAGNGR